MRKLLRRIYSRFVQSPSLDEMDRRYTVGQILRWLWRNLRGNRLQSILNATIGMFSVVCSLGMVWAMQRTVDMASGAREGSIYLGVALMGAVIIAEFALNISRVWIKNILGIRAQNRMQQKILDRLLRAEWKGKDRYHSGDIINRLEQDVQTVSAASIWPRCVSTHVRCVAATARCRAC